MGRIHTESNAPGFDDVQTDFQEHFNVTYPPAGGDYNTFEPAYSFGYQSALDEEFEGKDYEEVKEQLTRNYNQQYPNSDYDFFEEAIRYAYVRTRQMQR